MKKLSFLLPMLLSLFLLQGCGLIKGIFETGFWAGIILVLIVVIIIVIVVVRRRR
jgi:hypothetical protein